LPLSVACFSLQALTHALPAQDVNHAVVAFVAGILINLVRGFIKSNLAGIRGCKCTRIVRRKLVQNFRLTDSSQAFHIHFLNRVGSGTALRRIVGGFDHQGITIPPAAGIAMPELYVRVDMWLRDQGNDAHIVGHLLDDCYCIPRMHDLLITVVAGAEAWGTE